MFCNFVEICCRTITTWCPSMIQSIVVYRCITCTYCISYQSIMHSMHAHVTSLVYHAILVKNIAKFWKEKIWQNLVTIILRKAKMRIYRNSLSSNHCMASIKSLSNSRTMLCINGTINSILQSLVNIIRLKLFVHLNIYLQWGDTLNMHFILLLYQESVLQLHESKDDVIIAVATSVHFINSSI
jgi:hypothetical protein